MVLRSSALLARENKRKPNDPPQARAKIVQRLSLTVISLTHKKVVVSRLLLGLRVLEDGGLVDAMAFQFLSKLINDKIMLALC